MVGTPRESAAITIFWRSGRLASIPVTLRRLVPAVASPATTARPATTTFPTHTADISDGERYDETCVSRPVRATPNPPPPMLRAAACLVPRELLPTFRRQCCVQLIGMQPVALFEPAGLLVRRIVVHAVGHEIAFVHLVE